MDVFVTCGWRSLGEEDHGCICHLWMEVSGGGGPWMYLSPVDAVDGDLWGRRAMDVFATCGWGSLWDHRYIYYLWVKVSGPLGQGPRMHLSDTEVFQIPLLEMYFQAL